MDRTSQLPILALGTVQIILSQNTGNLSNRRAAVYQPGV